MTVFRILNNKRRPLGTRGNNNTNSLKLCSRFLMFQCHLLQTLKTCNSFDLSKACILDTGALLVSFELAREVEPKSNTFGSTTLANSNQALI